MYVNFSLGKCMTKKAKEDLDTTGTKFYTIARHMAADTNCKPDAILFASKEPFGAELIMKRPITAKRLRIFLIVTKW